MQIPSDLRGCRILISNDDGIHAPGIAALEAVARQFSDDVWVVAPETEQSGVAHSLTLHQPLRLRELSPQRYAVSGTPTDCVLLAIREIIPRDAPATLLLSGINRGSNVAEDVTYSGTIAAAMEGALLEVPSIALSQHYHDGQPINWETASFYAEKMLRHLQGVKVPSGHLLSVNIPAVAPNEALGFRLAPQGQRKIMEKLVRRDDPRGRPYYWIGGTGFDEAEVRAGTDHALLHEGYVTLTPLCLDLTNYDLLEALGETLSW
ncbi:MAG: 5'/3'-nucleotidase SurE [Rickettsiales bacterium]|nr:5'/3'-nucleotidase SurE [Rickettsiales bacterium]